MQAEVIPERAMGPMGNIAVQSVIYIWGADAAERV